MPRSGFLDLLSSFRFWAFDVGSFSLPVFNPLFGFSAITAPEIILDTEEIKDGTFIYPRTVAKGAQVSPIVFSRASAMWDSDFYDWITRAIYGSNVGTDNPMRSKLQKEWSREKDGQYLIRRNIVIVQFTRIDPLYSISRSFLDDTNLSVGDSGLGPFAVLSRLPARAWLLHDCIPTRYKASTDFDANNSQMSIMELEVKPEYIEEFSLGVGSPTSIF